jgi:hypothetical protein
LLQDLAFDLRQLGVDVDLSVPARRASSTVSRSAASGCIRPMMSDILRGAICEAMS